MVEKQGPGLGEGDLARAMRSIGEKVGVVKTEEDKIWEAYMGEKRDWREMIALLGEGQLKPEFERRILQVLLAPETNCLGADIDWRNQLTPTQSIYAAQLLNLYIPQVERRMDEQSKEVRGKYNELILKLLPVLPEEMAEKLFTHFNLNDIGPFSNMDFASGYNPLSNLYNDRVIDEGWKRKAAARMHEIILREETGKSKPRQPYEAATERYRYILDLMLYGELPMSSEFYQEEVAFLLTNTKEPVVKSWNTGKAMDLLTEQGLRHQFIRRQVLSPLPDSDKRHFSVYNQETMEIARRILGEYSQDPELQDYLRQQVRQEQVRLDEEKKRREEVNIREESILAHMRK